MPTVRRMYCLPCCVGYLCCSISFTLVLYCVPVQVAQCVIAHMTHLCNCGHILAPKKSPFILLCFLYFEIVLVSMCTQVYLCVHLYICAYICVCVHTFVYLCICVYICVFVRTFVYLWLHLRMCAYIHVYLCVHLRICAHTQPVGSPIRITPSPNGVLPCPEHRTRCLHRPLLISNPFSRLNMFPSILFSHLSIFTPLTVKKTFSSL